jgi:hypothetical protein
MSTPSVNRFCRSVGHDWAQDTIAENYRRCVRQDCKTVERLLDGAWVDVTIRHHSHQPPASLPPSLFPWQELVEASNEELRRAERLYRRLLGQ